MSFKPASFSKDGLSITTKLDKRMYIALAQYAHDMGLPNVQDANRILIAQALTNLGYPKEIHKIKDTTALNQHS